MDSGANSRGRCFGSKLLLHNGGRDEAEVTLDFAVRFLVHFPACNANSDLLDSRICSTSKEQETSGEKEAFTEASTISRSRESLADKAFPTR